MSRIRSKNTKLESRVRKALTSLGIRYRLHSKLLLGKPDIVIKSRRTAIFINGCFWHQHSGCKRCTMPKSNQEYWTKKLARNVEKQKNDTEQLKKDGWIVLKIWECEAKNLIDLTENLSSRLSTSSHSDEQSHHI